MARVIKASSSGEAGLARPGPTVRAVLNLRDLAAEARDIVLEARKEAAAIVAQAKAQAEQMKSQASQSAVAEGYAAGLAQARADAQSQLQAQTAELVDVANAVVGELAAARDQTLARMRQDMLNLALQLASKIVGLVAVSDIAAARANLEKVLALCHFGGEIVLKVNPQQLRRLQDHCRELTEALAVPGTVRLMGDDAVGPGGVKLISGSGEIDASIETQLANLAKGLVGGMGGLFEQAAADGAYVTEPNRGTAVPAVSGRDADKMSASHSDTGKTPVEHMGKLPMPHADKMSASQKDGA